MANTYNICTKLQSIADALGDAQTSDLINALADIAQAISQGGGGGTSDYTQLTNKPQINGYVLSGNQTGTQLGLQNTLTFDNTPTSGSSNPVTSDGVYDAIDTLNSNMIAMYDGTNYTSLVATIQPNSYYEAPEDGLYYFYLGSGTSSPAGLFTSSTISTATMIAQVNSGTGACIVPIPLKKGTKVYTRPEAASTYNIICRIG